MVLVTVFELLTPSLAFQVTVRAAAFVLVVENVTEFERRLVVGEARRARQREYAAGVAAGDAVLVREIQRVAGLQDAADGHRRACKRRAARICDRQRRVHRLRGPAQRVVHSVAGSGQNGRLIGGGKRDKTVTAGMRDCESIADIVAGKLITERAPTAQVDS